MSRPTSSLHPTRDGGSKQFDLLMEALGDMLRAMRAMEQYALETDTPLSNAVVATDQLEAAISLLRRGMGL